MIFYKTSSEIEIMAEGGKILAAILRELALAVKPGIKTKELDLLAHGLCREHKVAPAFLGYAVAGKKYPASLCVSVNDEVVHGIPSDRVLQKDDMVGLDMGVVYQGWNLDSAVTVEVQSEKRKAKNEKLIAVTREALNLGIAQAKPGNHIGDISHAIQQYIESNGFAVVRDLVGHGVGRKLHEEPAIPNFGKPGDGAELREGMVIAIEPMVTAGGWRVRLAADHWTYKTKDGSLSAHFEHTVAITKNGPVVLT